MAIVYDFPTEQQRTRASFEVIAQRIIEADSDLDINQQKNMLDMVMNTFNQYSKWNITGSVTPLPDQPFTVEQITEIQKGMAALGDSLTEYLRAMFKEILKLRVENFKLRNSIH